jgi:hypothetical protein
MSRAGLAHVSPFRRILQLSLEVEVTYLEELPFLFVGDLFDFSWRKLDCAQRSVAGRDHESCCRGRSERRRKGGKSHREEEKPWFTRPKYDGGPAV